MKRRNYYPFLPQNVNQILTNFKHQQDHTIKLNLSSIVTTNVIIIIVAPSSGWWYEEYASRNSTKEHRVLNRTIHSLPAINEYFKDTGDSSPKFLFNQGILALKNDLPKYDNNGTSSYDGLGLPANSFYKSLRFKNFNTIASYQKFTYDLKKIFKYKAEIDYLNSFSKQFSPNKYSARFLELKANY